MHTRNFSCQGYATQNASHSMKKNAQAFIDDLLNGTIEPQLKNLLLSGQQGQAAPLLDEHYEFTANDLQAALIDAKPRLETALGCPLSDEQLIAISGGKLSKEETIFAGVVGTASAGTLAIGIGTAIAIIVK